MPYKDKEKQRAWVEANRVRIREHKKKWRENNTEYHKNYAKDGYHYVYLLEDYNYVGCTNSISNRFRGHKSESSRDCTNHRILYKSKNRKDCLELEELLHNIGYEGAKKHSHYR